MPPKFYKQENGLLTPPPGVQKYHISWALDNILHGFRHFYSVNDRWPIGIDLEKCDYLPNVKTLERKFGGIRKIREQLGILVTDFSSGQPRSEMAREIWQRALVSEEQVRAILIERFYEPFVHNQARITLDERRTVRVDFLIYHSAGKFAVDIFHPGKEIRRFAGNIYMKYEIYKDFPFHVYLCVTNPEISREELAENSKNAQKSRNKKATLITHNDFVRILGDYTPLKDPYS